MSPATVEAGGVALAVDDRGSGPAVVFVHGVAASRTTWEETIRELGPDVRTVAYDRRAYGDSGAPEPYSGTTVGEQADDLAALIESVGAAPAVLVGHALGAMIALDVILRFGSLVSGAVLIEPPVLWLSPRGPESVGDMRDAIEQGARDGGPAGAVEGYLEYVAGDDALDLYGAARADAARRDIRAITTPLSLVTGWRSSPVWQETTRALAELLPSAKLIELEAGHLAMLEQPEAIGDAVRQRL